MLYAIAIILHLVAINIWVGGMFFIIIILGNAVTWFELPDQVIFWQKVLRRFFVWVWLAAALLLASGIGVIAYHYSRPETIPVYIKLMAVFGLLMVAVYSLIYFVFYRRFNRCMELGNIKSGRRQLRVIRKLGIVNMVLGLCVMIVIGGAPYVFI